jgi:hypothetical protein
MNPLLREALSALERGWSVLPIHAAGAALKQPHAGLLIAAGYREWVEDASRFRAVWKPLQRQAPSAEVVEHWFKDPAGLGLALVTGRVSGRVIIDFDDEPGRALVHDLSIRPHVRTGGGYHWHVQAPTHPVPNLVGKNTTRPGVPKCVDVRGDGGNAVLPPTVVPKGPYTYLRDPEDLAPLSEVPMALREALGLEAPLQPPTPVYQGPLPSGEDRVPADVILTWALSQVSTGGRNDTGYKLAWVLCNNGYRDDEVLSVGMRYVAGVPQPSGQPYTASEFQASARSARNAPRGAPWEDRRVSTPGQAGPEQGGHRPVSRVAVTAEHALQDIWASLDDVGKTRAAYLCAWQFAQRRDSLANALTFLRLLGHASVREARRAFEEYERGQTPDGTLPAFLQGRGVTYLKRGA